MFSCYCDVFHKDLISVTFTALFCVLVVFFTVHVKLKVFGKMLLQFILHGREAGFSFEIL